jgi:hypothetical protein
MERVDAKLIEWKTAYEALEAARAALKHAVEVGASDAEVRELRGRVDRLRTESDTALDGLGKALANRNRSNGPH